MPLKIGGKPFPRRSRTAGVICLEKTEAFCRESRQINEMNFIRFSCVVAGLLLISNAIVAARGVRLWSYQELLDRSDLVVIATPIATDDTKEVTAFPGFEGERFIGVQTRFAVSAFLKGDKTLTNLVLHHYRAPHGTSSSRLPNGPTFVSFAPRTSAERAYILFLVREIDGRYAPAAGQVDPALSVRELVGVAE